MTGLRTFDVFDTLLTRRVGTPEGVFVALGNRLSCTGVIDCTPEVFARTRMAAEPLAVSVAGGQQATLSGIYRQMTRLLDLDPDLAPILADQEVQMERELAVPVPGMRERVERLRDEGHEIAFVSDMYLPRDLIASLLDGHGFRHGDEQVHVSADLGVTKRHGDMYVHVLHHHHRAASEVHHTGDNLRADVEQALANGIDAEHVTDTAPNRYERVMERHRWESAGLASAFAGASRLARMSTPIASEHQRAIRDVTAGVAAPMLVGYVLWVLRRAKALQLDRLYFVSRDGEVLLRIAEQLSGPIGNDVPLRYLHGSRQAWYPAGTDPSRPKEAIESVRHTTDDSLDILLERCGVEPSAWLQPTIPRDSSAADEAELDRLLVEPAFLADVSAGLEERQQQISAYLDEMGLLDHGRFGIVDIGWHGRALDCLSGLFESKGLPAPTGLYLGLLQTGPLRQPTDAWLLGLEKRLRIAMMETFCAGTHGQVTNYVADEDGRVRPALRSPVNDPAMSWGLGTLRDTIDRFTAELVPVIDCFPHGGNMRFAAMSAFRTFYDDPTVAEARAWGSFPFEVSPSAASTEHLASERNLLALARERFSGTGTTRWPAGDLALAPPSWRRLVNGWHAGKRMRARL